MPIAVFAINAVQRFFFKSSRWPAELHIAIVNIQQTLDREPQCHVNWSSHQSWIHLADDLPKNE